MPLGLYIIYLFDFLKLQFKGANSIITNSKIYKLVNLMDILE